MTYSIGKPLRKAPPRPPDRVPSTPVHPLNSTYDTLELAVDEAVRLHGVLSDKDASEWIVFQDSKPATYVHLATIEQEDGKRSAILTLSALTKKETTP